MTHSCGQESQDLLRSALDPPSPGEQPAHSVPWEFYQQEGRGLSSPGEDLSLLSQVTATKK